MVESHCSNGSRVIPKHWTLTSARSSVKRCRKQSLISMRYVNRCPCGQGMSITLALPHLWVCSIRNSIRSKQFADLLRKIKYHQTELPRQGIRSTRNIWSSWSFLGTWIFLAFGQCIKIRASLFLVWQTRNLIGLDKNLTRKSRRMEIPFFLLLFTGTAAFLSLETVGKG